MKKTTSTVLISITPDGDILFIKKGTKDGLTTARLATFLNHDNCTITTPDVRLIRDHLSDYLKSKIIRLRTNEFITITIATFKKDI